MISVAKCVLQNGYCQLSTAFRSAFPQLTYKTGDARQRLLRMPLACVRIGDLKKGSASWYLVEYVPGVDYVRFACFADAIYSTKHVQSPTMEKKELKALLTMAQSDRERELIRYSVVKTSWLSATGARKAYGLERMKERIRGVEGVIEEARLIRTAIDNLAKVQDKAVLLSMGIPVSSESDSDTDSDEGVPLPPSGDMLQQDEGSGSLQCPTNSDPLVQHEERLNMPDFQLLHTVLKDAKFNWYALVQFAEQLVGDLPSLRSHLEQFFQHEFSQQLAQSQKTLLEQSHAAFTVTEICDPSDSRTIAALNGEVVSESESDNPDEYGDLSSHVSEAAKKIIAKKRKALAHKLHREKAKAVATKHFLSRKVSKKVKTVVDRFPDIGKEIE